MRNNTEIDVQFIGYNGKDAVTLSHLTFNIDDEK